MSKGKHKRVGMATTLERLSGPEPVPDLSQGPRGETLPPVFDPKTRGFAKGNQAARLRAIKNKARGISSLSPLSVPNFMKPHVADGVAYAGQLLRTLEDRPVLLPLAGMVADSYTVGKALMEQALKMLGEGDTSGFTMKEKYAVLATARSWLQDSKDYLSTLTKLQAEAVTLSPGGAARLRDRMIAEASAKAASESITTTGTVEAAAEVKEEVATGIAGLRQQIRAGGEDVEIPAPPPTDPALGDGS